MLTLKSSTVAFKEWSLVCDALEAGRQAIILRKGGIAEGRGGFQWQKDAFLLFPTLFHEQDQRVTWRSDHPAPEAPDGFVDIRLFAQLEGSWTITDWKKAAALAPLHIWTEDVIRDRFGYGDSTGLSLALLRVHRLPSPWRLPMQPSFGGCRSWLDLPEHETENLTAVLSDDAFTAIKAQVEEIVG